MIGMDRIRAAYLELAPDVERYFVMSARDDPPGIRITMLAGVIVALVTLRMGGTAPAILGTGALGFAVALLLQGHYVQRSISKVQSGLHPHFPTPAGDR